MAVASAEGKGKKVESSVTPEDVFGVIKRKLSKVQADLESNCESVIQRILPGRRKSSSSSRPSSLYSESEGEWPMLLEHIEMASMKQRETGRGHQFVTCQLMNPTWCDKCGDFIWGLYKQCERCKNCQYTCHSHCVPSVTLDCMTVSPGSSDGPVATPSDLPASPCGSAETSLTERQTLVTYQSPQKQQQCTSERSQTVSQNARSLTPPGGAQRVSTPPRDTSSSERDPLLGACVAQTSVSTKGLLSSPSVCVGSDSNQNADQNIACGVLQEGRVKEVISDAANEKDETDSGYRSGTIPDEKLPKAPSQATLDRKELRRKVETFNHFVPKANLEVGEDGITFRGFLRVTLNLVRPITMELGARPPSIYELLTREHIVEQSTQHIAFYMPRDTVKSIHISSKTTTREVITSLLKKFHIVDNPRKFAMYEQEFNDKNKLVKLRRLGDKDFPLYALLSWKADCIKYYRLVLQENETGEIMWDAFSVPELKNFMVVLDREENEAITQLQYKYRIMKRIIIQRMKELKQDKASQNESTA